MTQDEINAFVDSNVTCTDDDVKIVDSCTVSKHDFQGVLQRTFDVYPDSVVLKNRKWWHIKLEWSTHNFLFSIGMWRSHTKDVDINYPMKWYEKLAYLLVGPICWLLIK